MPLGPRKESRWPNQGQLLMIALYIVICCVVANTVYLIVTGK